MIRAFCYESLKKKVKLSRRALDAKKQMPTKLTTLRDRGEHNSNYRTRTRIKTNKITKVSTPTIITHRNWRNQTGIKRRIGENPAGEERVQKRPKN